ncbi:MAG: alpha/beta fold hydrolase [Hyphomicrobiales bacterium]
MKGIFKWVALCSFAGLVACGNPEKKENTKKEETPYIGKKDIKLNSDVMTPEVLWSFGRLGGVQISPDKKQILYGISYYDIPLNKSNRDLYVMNIDGSNKKQITKTTSGLYNATWTPDGNKIAYMSYESGSMQMWIMNTDGSKAAQVSDVEDGITGFSFSPDGKKVLFTKEIYPEKKFANLYKDLPQTTGRVMDDLMYRHWDVWVDSYPHPFVADFDGKQLSNIKDIMEGEPFESPVKPWGGMEQLAWSPDGKTIVYTSRKLTGKEYALSTNTDIYSYDLATGKTTNLTIGMMGYDQNPVFSPDGKMLAWESMERDGYEADRVRIFIRDMGNGINTEYSKDFDNDAHGLSWTPDSKTLYFVSNNQAKDQIFKLDIASKEITQITKGVHNFKSATPVGDVLIAQKMSMSMPTEIFSVNPTTGEDTQISDVNDNLLGQLKMGKVEERWIKTTDGKEMLTWVIYPPHFDPNKKYPAILYCQGGPQSGVSQFFSFRWNFQMMAANDYIVVAPNRRGVPGFGQAWKEQISQDYPGQNMEDYFAAIDEVAKEPFVDEKNLSAVGASYGGFSVYWLAGNHNKRFNAFISHCGMFNLESMYTETEEMWFVNWDLGGPYWDKKNKVAQRSFANSPHKFVQNWDTPLLVVHGQNDYRIPFTQGMGAFNAAKLKGVPAEFLYFPDENHWVLKPQNGILWQRTFSSWLDKWCKK